MAQTYRIRSGAQFLLHDGTRLGAGELIELEHDVAQAHADKLEHIPVAAADAPAETGPGLEPAEGQP